jgi:hypothetical protein
VQLPHHAQQSPRGSASDSIARLISINASAAKRTIPGSMPVTQPGLQPGPIGVR